MVDDFPYDDIGKVLGRSSASVRGYVNRTMKAKPRRHVWKPTAEQIDRVWELREMGYSRPRIARAMKCTLANIRKVIDEPVK